MHQIKQYIVNNFPYVVKAHHMITEGQCNELTKRYTVSEIKDALSACEQCPPNIQGPSIFDFVVMHIEYRKSNN